MLRVPNAPQGRKQNHGISTGAQCHFSTQARGKQGGIPTLGKAAGHDGQHIIRLRRFPCRLKLIGMSPVEGIVFRHNADDPHFLASCTFFSR